LFTYLFFITLLLLLLKMTTQRKELTIFEREKLLELGNMEQVKEK
jgi:hypothetical protein